MSKVVETKVTIMCDICDASAKEFGAWFRIENDGWDNIYGQHLQKRYVDLREWQESARLDWDIDNSVEAAATGVCLCEKHYQPIIDLIKSMVDEWNTNHIKERELEAEEKL